MTPLLSLLKNIQQQSQQLHDCLQEEKQALSARQYEELVAIADKKQSLVDALNALDQQRLQHSDNKNFNKFIAESGDTELIRQWNSTRGVISDCQQQNEVNGRLLGRQQMIQQDILSLITGRGAEQHDTYSADGNQRKQGHLLNNIKA